MSSQRNRWEDSARCQGVSRTVFFPKSTAGLSARNAYQAVAEAWCAKCPVRQQCLELAMDAEGSSGARYDLFGGLSPSQRAALYLQRTNQTDAA